MFSQSSGLSQRTQHPAPLQSLQISGFLEGLIFGGWIFDLVFFFSLACLAFPLGGLILDSAGGGLLDLGDISRLRVSICSSSYLILSITVKN